jgi:dolichol-phosphate mannosyltransferase
MTAQATMITLISPAYNEAENLPVLYMRLKASMEAMGCSWEWIVVDDHSSDGTFAAMEKIASGDGRVRVVRFARNFGSHTAIKCGLDMAVGDCAVVLAADLQDSPETIAPMLARWRAGAQVVWAVRNRREGESASTVGFARLYYWMMRRIVGLRELPPSGADFFLLDRRVVEAARGFNEGNVSILALLTWMGFRQEYVSYDKQARLHGSSGWNTAKKVKLVIDSVTSFTYLPIRLMAGLGFAVALMGFLYAAFVVGNAIFGKPIQGWSSLMIVVLILGGMQMLMMGVLGEYLWSALDESRRRPRYIVERDSKDDSEREKPT